VVRRRPDGGFDLVLDQANRDALHSLLGELEDLLEHAPDDPSVQRLHPPAYTDDPERDLGYQILAGDELRTRRQETIDAVRASLRRTDLTEDELWSWLQALNALRLVVGTRLDIRDDDHRHPRLDPDHPDVALWEVYDFTTQVQYFVITALTS
jgi:hypothetical protein